MKMGGEDNKKKRSKPAAAPGEGQSSSTKQADLGRPQDGAFSSASGAKLAKKEGGSSARKHESEPQNKRRAPGNGAARREKEDNPEQAKSKDELRSAKKIKVLDANNEKRAKATAPAAAAVAIQGKPSAPTSRLDKYKKKLEGAKFRLLNESLYTGEKAETGLTGEEFSLYHQGFDHQVSKWPTNPVDVIIDRFLRRSKKRLDVGDLGCGTAKIAERQGKFHNIHSFDLVAANERVQACDIARDGVPLPDDSLDMVIFSLSLMDERPAPYIKEARRCLRTNGTMIIAEVKSRFVTGSDSSEETTSLKAMRKGLNEFCSGLDKMGFSLVEMDAESNKMFVLLVLKKRKPPHNDSAVLVLKPCEYKRR